MDLQNINDRKKYREGLEDKIETLRQEHNENTETYNDDLVIMSMRTLKWGLVGTAIVGAIVARSFLSLDRNR